eukprot:GILK01012699.1.p1 GENE.GILK01012699.1~~GILK01012699.1.p1  ORF type:complete len:775 (+),score=148.68 GILK01012699.1:279-2327(+)
MEASKENDPPAAMNLKSSASVVGNSNSNRRKEAEEQEVTYIPPETRFEMTLDLWKQYTTHPGAGLMNLGNTCYMNSVLQCLTYTPHVCSFLLSKLHSSHCTVDQWCLTCEAEKHIKRVLGYKEGNGNKRSSHSRVSAYAPENFAKNLPRIGRQFRRGVQEDAHEFLRLVVEKIQKMATTGETNKLTDTPCKSPYKSYTTIDSILGGYLRSQVKCTECGFESNTFDPFMDLSLDIDRVSSLLESLNSFTKPEMLKGENKYRCSRCKKKVVARKQFTIFRNPKVLTIQLKRFKVDWDVSRFFGGKISKHVDFPTELDLSPFISESDQDGGSVRYELTSVLIHSGLNSSSGHYFCYCKTSANTWHLFDDSTVRSATEEEVLRQKAYLLIYSKIDSSSLNQSSSSTATGDVMTLQPNSTRTADITSKTMDVVSETVQNEQKQNTKKQNNKRKRAKDDIADPSRLVNPAVHVTTESTLNRVRPNRSKHSLKALERIKELLSVDNVAASVVHHAVSTPVTMRSEQDSVKQDGATGSSLRTPPPSEAHAKPKSEARSSQKTKQATPKGGVRRKAKAIDDVDVTLPVVKRMGDIRRFMRVQPSPSADIQPTVSQPLTETVSSTKDTAAAIATNTDIDINASQNDVTVPLASMVPYSKVDSIPKEAVHRSLNRPLWTTAFDPDLGDMESDF